MNWIRRLKFWVTRQDFLAELRSLLDQIHTEMDPLRQGQTGPITLGQLEVVAKELEDLHLKAQNGSLPHPEQRKLAAAWYVVDSWPYDHPLSERIMDLQALYRKSL